MSVSDEKTAPIVTVVKVPTFDTFKEEQESFHYLNQLRLHAGMSQFFYNENLQKSASSHANYLVANSAIGHNEEMGKVGFSGIFPHERIIKAGYKTGMSIENVSSNTIGYKKSIDALFSAIYHRFGFLDFQVNEIGIGMKQDDKDSAKTAYVYNMGIYELNELCKKDSYSGNGEYTYKICADENLKIQKSLFDIGYNACRKSNKKIVIYPYAKQINVPPAFYDELPDPLPEYMVSGFPISIQFNPYYFQIVKLKRFELFLGENKVTNVKLYDHISDINSLFKRNEFALFPLERLNWDSQYRVEVEYQVDDETFVKRWFFKTKKLSTKPIIIDKKTMQVKISNERETILYFKPQHKNDILDNIQYSSKLHLTLIDNNTIKIKTDAEDRALFRLNIADWKIALLVEGTSEE